MHAASGGSLVTTAGWTTNREEERSMKNHLNKGVMALVCLTACLTLVLVPAPVNAQSSPVAMTIRVNPLTTSPGGTVGVFAFVTNTSGSRLRTTATISSLAPCGIETNLGYNKLVLNPGQTVQVTVSYPLAPDACLGTYAVSISVSSGKNGTVSSTTAYLTVQ
jgi:hypothetical protein